MKTRVGNQGEANYVVSFPQNSMKGESMTNRFEGCLILVTGSSFTKEIPTELEDQLKKMSSLGLTWVLVEEKLHQKTSLEVQLQLYLQEHGQKIQVLAYSEAIAVSEYGLFWFKPGQSQARRTLADLRTRFAREKLYQSRIMVLGKEDN